MGDNRDNILEQIEKNIPTECPECRERLYFKGSGKYICSRCHKTYYDDFGRIKNYLEEHGSAPVIEIAENTGVSIEVIDTLFEEGRLEMPKELREAARCERCGALYSNGRYCEDCIKFTSKGMLQIFLEEEALRKKFAKSKHDRENEMKLQYEKDKMHYLNYARDRK